MWSSFSIGALYRCLTLIKFEGNPEQGGGGVKHCVLICHGITHVCVCVCVYIRL